MSGAMIVLIIRMKIWLRRRMATAVCGQSCPTSAPTTIEKRIQAVSERRPYAQSARPAMSVQRPARPSPGAPEAHASEATSAPSPTRPALARPRRPQPPLRPSPVLILPPRRR